jgi:hypothetical protein
VSGFKVDILHEFGEFEVGNTSKVVVNLVKYGNSDTPVLNIQTYWKSKGSDVWQPGKRPAMTKKLLEQLIPVLQQALKLEVW